MHNNIKLDNSDRVKRIVLHVGVPKTASTSIQSTLQNSKFCYPEKYYYPESLSPFTLTSIFSDDLELVGAPQAMRWLLRQAASAKTINRIKENFFRELNNNSFETLIISNEFIATNFFSTSALIKLKHFLVQLYRNIQLDVVVYVRHPLSFYTSMRQQLIQWGEPYDFKLDKQFLQPGELICSHLERITNVFGRNNIQIYKFEDTLLHKYGPLGFFLEKVMQLKQEEISKMYLSKKNTSIPQIAANICNFINQKKVDFGQDMAKVIGLQALTNCLSGDKFKLSKKEKLKFMPKFNAEIKILEEIFGISYPALDAISDVEEDGEASDMPSKKNLQEISRAFSKFTPFIRKYILEYLEDISKKYSDDMDIKNTINHLCSLTHLI